jgi:hypothetical protein
MSLRHATIDRGPLSAPSTRAVPARAGILSLLAAAFRRWREDRATIEALYHLDERSRRELGVRQSPFSRLGRHPKFFE